MHVGSFLAYRPWSTPQEQVELAVLADERGLDSGDKRAVVEALARAAG